MTERVAQLMAEAEGAFARDELDVATALYRQALELTYGTPESRAVYLGLGRILVRRRETNAPSQTDAGVVNERRPDGIETPHRRGSFTTPDDAACAGGSAEPTTASTPPGVANEHRGDSIETAHRRGSFATPDDVACAGGSAEPTTASTPPGVVNEHRGDSIETAHLRGSFATPFVSTDSAPPPAGDACSLTSVAGTDAGAVLSPHQCLWNDAQISLLVSLLQGWFVFPVPAGMERAIRARWRRSETTRQVLAHLHRIYPTWSLEDLHVCIDVTMFHPLLHAIDAAILPDVVRLIGGAPVAHPAAAVALEQLLAATSPSHTLLRGQVRRDRLGRLRTYLENLLADEIAALG
jgi:hypothetical protein